MCGSFLGGGSWKVSKRVIVLLKCGVFPSIAIFRLIGDLIQTICGHQVLGLFQLLLNRKIASNANSWQKDSKVNQEYVIVYGVQGWKVF